MLYPAVSLSHQQVIADENVFHEALKQLHKHLGTRYRVPTIFENEA